MANDRIPPDEHPVLEKNGYLKVNLRSWPLRISGSMTVGYLLMTVTMVPTPGLLMKHQRHKKRANTVQRTKRSYEDLSRTAFLLPVKDHVAYTHSLKDANQSHIPRCSQNHRTLNLCNTRPDNLWKRWQKANEKEEKDFQKQTSLQTTEQTTEVLRGWVWEGNEGMQTWVEVRTAEQWRGEYAKDVRWSERSIHRPLQSVLALVIRKVECLEKLSCYKPGRPQNLTVSICALTFWL